MGDKVETEMAPHVALQEADEVTELIKVLHAQDYQTLRSARLDAERRFCQPEIATLARQQLAIGCGLSALAQHAANLQIVAEDRTYARRFWSRRVWN